MANPGILAGPLNRLIVSVLFPNFPGLNITPSYLTREGVDIAPEGVSTTNIPTMTGIVTSPEPYQMVRITCHLIRSLSFADSWKQQIEQSTLLGPCTLRPDTPALSPYVLGNTSITGFDRQSYGGNDAGYVINLAAVYQINAALWP